MPDCDVLGAFRYATEDLSTTIHEQAQYMSMWMNLVPKGTLKLNAGTRFVNFGIGNTEPITTVGAWKQMALSRDRAGCQQGIDDGREGETGVDGLCTNQWQEVAWGSTELDYGPEYWQLKGPLVCRAELQFSHNIDQYLLSYVRKLRIRAQREWENNYAFNTARYSRQAVATGHFSNSWNAASNYSLTITGTDPSDPTYVQTLKFGTVVPLKKATSLLTQQMLEFVADELIDLGATDPDEHGFISLGDDGPIFSVYISSALSLNILRANSELRQDYRYADPQQLIKRLGAKRIIGNWRHIINQREWRFSYTSGGVPDGDADDTGTYTFIEPFVDSADVNAYGTPIAGRGRYMSPNKLWRDAQYGSVFVLSRELWTSEVTSERSSAGGLSFPNTGGMGEFKFVTGAYKFGTADANCADDPLEDKGRHFATFMHAPSPNPMAVFQYGWIIFYDRTSIKRDAAAEVTTIN